MTDNDKEKGLMKKESEEIQKSGEDHIYLGYQQLIDMTGMSDEQKKLLKQKHAEGLIDVGKKAALLAVDTQALGAKLRTIAQSTNEVMESGSSITITNVNDDSLGRTEIIIGDSDAARKGKLTRSQTGSRDYTLYYIGTAIVIILILALLVR